MLGAVVQYRTRNQEVACSTHTRSTANNFELRGEGVAWLIGAMVCLLAASWVQLSVSAGNGWPHNALRHHWLMSISCHFRDCKALLVTMTYVIGAIASVQTLTLTSIHSVHVNGRSLYIKDRQMVDWCWWNRKCPTPCKKGG